MKKLCVGVIVGVAFLLAQAASAEPCGLCQAYYPCWWTCEHCVEGRGGPGLWEYGGGCWGEIVSGTCGDTGQCNENLSTWGGTEQSANLAIGGSPCAGAVPVLAKGK